jgi:DNA-binding NtrC family response regulator
MEKRSARVLYVEDEGLLHSLIIEELADRGFQVLSAWNGDEAIRIINNGVPFDILVTDVRMPGSANGFDVAKYVRTRHPECPIVIVSGYPGDTDGDVRNLMPRVVFRPKPYRLNELVDCIRQMTATC